MTPRESQGHSFTAFNSGLVLTIQKVRRLIGQKLRFERADGFDAFVPTRIKLPRFVLIILSATVATIVYVLVTTPMDWQKQTVFSGTVLCLALVLRRYQGRLISLLLIFLSLITSSRYFYWRINNTLDLDTAVELTLGLGLFAAELYAFLILLLGYIQTAWPLRRRQAQLPADSNDWPSVDVFIPTYNESLDVVKPTVLAALGLDWPENKLNIFLLDDGRRPQHREFAAAVGVHYLTRPDNKNAKAGNLNHALTKSTGDFIAIFDCDHIPVRSFLTETMGWFLADPKCALVQTPHHFFSPDPIERNLHTFHRVPNEGKLFYGLVMDGNDLWNASFFCGSCAVLRRAPLLEVGGIAVETVTEDAHTALKLHRRGYNSAYINKILAAGLATESLSGHVGQRIRWARGMAQIFATDNPLFGKGLSWVQRLCYSNSMLHFFHGLPRIVFLTSPLAFLFFGLHIFNAEAIMVAAYVMPHLLQAVLANSQLQSKVRHAYWAEVYESLLAWYVAIPTTLALIAPKIGSFNVTSKGGKVTTSYFDWRISRPMILLALLCLGGLVMGTLRLLVWQNDKTGTVVITLLWAIYNLLILGAAIGVAHETRQVRHTHRVDWELPVKLRSDGFGPVNARTENVSLGGVRLHLEAPVALEVGAVVTIGLPNEEEIADFDMRVVACSGLQAALEFLEMSQEAEKALIKSTFGRADAWADEDTHTAGPSQTQSLLAVLDAGLRGYLDLFRHAQRGFSALVGRNKPHATEGL